jgi:hypothetical protein
MPNFVLYDRLGNVWNRDKLVLGVLAKEVRDDEFFCIVCGEIKPLSVGCVASYEIGGWVCSWHFMKPKKRKNA